MRGPSAHVFFMTLLYVDYHQRAVLVFYHQHSTGNGGDIYFTSYTVATVTVHGGSSCRLELDHIFPQRPHYCCFHCLAVSLSADPLYHYSDNLNSDIDLENLFVPVEISL